MVHYVSSSPLSHCFALILFLGKYLTINQLQSLLPLSAFRPLMHSWRSARHKKRRRRLPPELHGRNAKPHRLLAPADPITNVMQGIQSQCQVGLTLVIPGVRATTRIWTRARRSLRRSLKATNDGRRDQCLTPGVRATTRIWTRARWSPRVRWSQRVTELR
jgi:hypothetical protein